MDIKGLLKRVGKGLVVVAASIVAGITLGPIAATALGGFLSQRIGALGISVAQATIERSIQEVVFESPRGIIDAFDSARTKKMAEEISAESGVPQEEARAAVQFAMRDLKTQLDSVVGTLQADRSLQAEALEVAREMDVKIDELLSQSEVTQRTVEDVRSLLLRIETRLDKSYREVMSSFRDTELLDYDRLMIMSRLQEQNVALSSRFDVEYDSSLYVPRTSDEGIFESFVNNAGMTNRNLFLVLGDVGMGKTWFLARLAEELIDQNYPTFFVTLRFGLRGLTSIFGTDSLRELVYLLDRILAPERKTAFIFLDGLDEMDPSEIGRLLGALKSSRVSTVSFVLTCRVADWATDSEIVQLGHELEHYIQVNQVATAKARKRQVGTPVSVLMSEFTESEYKAALSGYELPEDVPDELSSILTKPFFLRLMALHYSRTGNLPPIASIEFINLFAGGHEPTNTVLGRLGVMGERDILYDVTEEFIINQKDVLSWREIKSLKRNSPEYNIFVSAGLIQVVIGTVGTSISLNPDYILPLMILTFMRHSPERIQVLLKAAMEWKPDIARKIMVLLEIPEEPTTEEKVPSDTGKIKQQMDTFRGLLEKDAEEPPKPEEPPEPLADEFNELIENLTDSDPDVRHAAVDALGKLRDERAVEPLIKALNDSDGKVVAMVIRSLGLIADPRAIEALRKLADTTEIQDIAIKARWVADSIAEKAKKREQDSG